MKRFLIPIGVALGALLLFVYANSASIINKTNAILCDLHLIPTPDQLFFAEEAVPLHIVDVKERLDRELLVNTYWQSNTFLFIKRAHKYFPIIEPILKKNGVPDEFKYVAVIESGLTNAISPAGARGFWQFMPETAKEYGLESELLNRRIAYCEGINKSCSDDARFNTTRTYYTNVYNAEKTILLILSIIGFCVLLYYVLKKYRTKK